MKQEYVGYLGKGAIGVVNLVVNQEYFAYKQIDLMIDLDEAKNAEEDLNIKCSNALFEFELMKKNYPNVVRSHQYNYDEKKKIFSFTMDYMKNGDLSKFSEKEQISFKCYKEIFKDIVTG